VGALLLAGLKHPLVLAHGLDHLAPLADRVAQGLLAVHVLARLAGMDAGQVVPVLGGGIDDDGHVLLVEQCAVVLVGLAAVILGPFGRALQIEVGHGHDAGVGGRCALPPFADDQLPVAPPAADDAHADLVVGPEGRGGHEPRAVRQGDGCRGGAHRLTEHSAPRDSSLDCHGSLLRYWHKDLSSPIAWRHTIGSLPGATRDQRPGWVS